MESKDAPASLSFAGGSGDKTIIDRIMLRFRPIAPKPADNSQLPGFPPVNASNQVFYKGRTKRKYVRVCKSNRFNKKKTTASECEQLQEEREERISNGLNGIVTLQLLPETSDLRDSKGKLEETWCNLDLNAERVIDSTVWISPQRLVVVDTWVTVECVTDSSSCMNGENNELGLGEADRVKIELELDTCPGFISDGLNDVAWVNGAFNRMVVGSNEERYEVRVLFGVKEKVIERVKGSRLMTCWVKVQYTWQNEKCCMMVPCDARRLDNGGFAWKLDVEASLRLGR